MFDSTGKDAIGRGVAGSRTRTQAGRRLQVEALEPRQMLTATLAPIANVTSPQFLGTVVSLDGGSGNPQTYTVTSDVPGVKATIAQGRFLTLGVSHTSSGAGDIDVNGTMTFQLSDDITPVTTSKIESLVNGTATGTTSAVINGENFYVGKTFFRIANNFPTASTFIIQGGSASGSSASNPSAFTVPFNDEFIQSVAFTGTGQLAMANSGSDTNDSQFFITTGSPRGLDHLHTIFGQIVAGRDVLAQLTQVKLGSSDGTTPVSAVTITSATLSDTNPDGVVRIDTTVAPIGATANIRVTATDPTDNTTATQTFQVGVTSVSAGVANYTLERPFLGPVEPSITVGMNQPATFQLTAVSPDPTTTLTYLVRGGVSGGAFTDVQNATATVSPTGLVTVTPTAGFSGTINLVVGVKGSGATGDTPAAYDTQALTVVVNTTATPVALRPVATSPSIVVPTNQGSTVQLSGNSPSSSATAVTFALLTQPTNGTITNFDATTGTLTYTPTAGYTGPDSFTFESQDASNNLASFPATVKINVTNANTSAVRYIDVNGGSDITQPGYLIVTPTPRKRGTNVIAVTTNGNNTQVTVNGVIDAIQPPSANVLRVVLYGSKANDRITVDPSVTSLVTLDGGHGGKNVLLAGAGDSTLHGWFGQNTLTGGDGNDTLVGRRGHVKFRPSGGSDTFFSGSPRVLAQNTRDRKFPKVTSGTYFKFVGNKLVETSNPLGGTRVTRSARTHKA